MRFEFNNNFIYVLQVCELQVTEVEKNWSVLVSGRLNMIRQWNIIIIEKIM